MCEKIQTEIPLFFNVDKCSVRESSPQIILPKFNTFRIYTETNLSVTAHHDLWGNGLWGLGIVVRYPPPTLIILQVDLVHHFINATCITLLLVQLYCVTTHWLAPVSQSQSYFATDSQSVSTSWCRLKLKLKLIYDRQSVRQSVMVSGAHLGPLTNFSFAMRFSVDSCGFVVL
jgi:hypothetical protein